MVSVGGVGGSPVVYESISEHHKEALGLSQTPDVAPRLVDGICDGTCGEGEVEEESREHSRNDAGRKKTCDWEKSRVEGLLDTSGLQPPNKESPRQATSHSHIVQRGYCRCLERSVVLALQDLPTL